MSDELPDTEQYMLSTIDNPFSPFDQFDAWYAFDEAAGYHSSALLARLTFTADDLSEAEQRQATQQVIDEIVEYNVLGVSIKVKASDFKL